MSSQRFCSIEQFEGVQDTLERVEAAENAESLKRFQSFPEGDFVSCVDAISPAFSVLATSDDQETDTHQELNGIVVAGDHAIFALGSLYLQLDDRGCRVGHYQFVTGYDATPYRAEAEFEGLLRDRSSVQITGATKHKYGIVHTGFKIGRTRNGCFTVCHLPNSVEPVDVYHVRPEEEASVLDVFDHNPDSWIMPKEYIESDVMRAKKPRVQHQRNPGRPKTIKRRHGLKTVNTHRHQPRI